MEQQDSIALVGKPNSGKSTLFNLLTGMNQKIGNFSGVTVERKTGSYKGYEIVDLPGLKSLRSTAPEEVISKSQILRYAEHEFPIIFVANGMQMEDSLLLFSEVADLEVPVVLVINYKDDLEKNKILIDEGGIADQLGCDVVVMNSRTGDGLEKLEAIIKSNGFKVPNSVCRSVYDRFEGKEIENIYRRVVSFPNPEDDELIQDSFHKRQKIISSIVKSTIQRDQVHDYLQSTKKWDKILLHPIYGLIIFLAVLYLVFQAVFTISAFPMDWIDQGMAGLSSYVKSAMPDNWLQDLIADAIIQGIGGVIIFIPQIAMLFLLLGILEHTGYLSRISFISDAFLRKFGLSGKSIIPLMSSWACAIPAIMGARVIDDPKERMAIIMASPLMTCSARLPVYTILIAVILPQEKGSIFGLQGLALLGLYLIGVVATLAVALYYSKRSKVQSNPFWSLELPVYRTPNWRNIFNNVYQKTKSFVVEAGKVILAISIIIWFLSTNSPNDDQYISQHYQIAQAEMQDGTMMSKESFDLEYSYLGHMGKFIEPAIAPLGYDWKIGIAVLSSFAAREVFVGTLSTIYSIGSEEESTIIERLRNETVFSTGAKRFGIATSVSLLLFYVFALQCMSTVAIVKKETRSWRFAAFQFVLMLVLAYVFALVAYQLLK